jgi:hypothetical protein
MDLHSDQQLGLGFLPYCRQRGLDKIQGGLANLWYAAAKALGLNISTICSSNPLMVYQVASICVGIKSLAPLPGQLRCPPWLLDVVFLDLADLPLGPDSTEYLGSGRRPIFSTVWGLRIVFSRAWCWFSWRRVWPWRSPPPLRGGGHAQCALLTTRLGGPPQAAGPSLCGIPLISHG